VSWLRAERLLPFACAAACAMLAASEFMDTFKLNGPGPTLETVQTASDQHHYALLVLAAFAIVALVIAVATGSKPAAAAVAIAGILALLLFLLIDLPDAGKVGTLDDPRQSFAQAKADPAAGFWIELVGALVLAVCGSALATLTSDQLRSFGRSTGEGADKGSRPTPKVASGKDGSGPETPRKPSVASEPRTRKASRSGEAG
jgi:hypothetical protein